MEKKTQLKHPRGKKPVRMGKDKYDLLKRGILKFLRAEGEATHLEMIAAIESDFRKRRTEFGGSVPWHVEWVKLDLEARKVIKRVADSSPQKYKVAR